MKQMKRFLKHPPVGIEWQTAVGRAALQLTGKDIVSQPNQQLIAVLCKTVALAKYQVL